MAEAVEMLKRRMDVLDGEFRQDLVNLFYIMRTMDEEDFSKLPHSVLNRYHQAVARKGAINELNAIRVSIT